MKINSFDITPYNKALPMFECSGNSSKAGLLSSRFVKKDFATNGSIASVTSRLRRNLKSPYLIGDNSQPIPRRLDKKAVQKETSPIVSSFSLAVNIYKANSDEFKPLKQNKKIKKSVLTLPNEQSLLPERCTVSDMNDSEYFNKDDGCHKIRPKKKKPCQNNKQLRHRNRSFQYYDRDARYCSQFGIDLDCSSNDTIKHFDGDRKRVSRAKKPYVARQCQAQNNFNGHNVWKLLRNINRFQLIPSPPASDDSIVTPRKKKVPKRYKRKNTSFIGTCHTEEFAYISSIEVDSKSPETFSHSSSFDRVTVIENQDSLSEICKEIEKTIAKTHSLGNDENIKKINHTKNAVRTKKKVPQCIFNNEQHNDKQIKSIDHRATDTINENNFDDKIQIQNNIIVSAKNIKGESDNSVESCKNDLKITNVKHQEQIDDTNELHDSFVYSGNSGSSKKGCNSKKDNEKTIKLSSDESSQFMKGITKVILSKGHDRILTKQMEPQRRKPRSVTTMPTSMRVPKLTQIDIKRRLANIKFPLVILGKDELSSTIQVNNFCDYPQFAGLNEHIWPFMVEWNNKKKIKRKNKESNKPIVKSQISQTENRLNNDRKSNHTVVHNQTCKDKRNHIIESINLNQREGGRSLLQIKQKPIHHMKDKILKVLFKKLPSINCYEGSPQVGGGDVKNIASEFLKTKNDFGANPNPIVKEHLKKRYKNPLNTLFMKNKYSTFKVPWNKGSNFIETIIMNIKNGIYYNEDPKFVEKEPITTLKEASIQTQLTLNNILEIKTDRVESLKAVTSNEVSDINSSLIKSIPGFDDMLPELEIKTLNKNKIEVMHCISNIMVEFDVTLPMDQNINLKEFKNSSDVMPFEVTDMQTKVFKCKTSILNAMLPAELCSLIPNMIKNIITSDAMMTLPVSSGNKIEPYLSTISELSIFETTDTIKIPLKQISTSHNHIGLPSSPYLLLGVSFNPIKNNPKRIFNKFNWLIGSASLDLLPSVTNKLLIPCAASLREIIPFKELRDSAPLKSQIVENHPIKQIFCTSVQCYSLKNWRVATTFEPYSFDEMIRRVWESYNSSNLFIIPIISLIKITWDISNRVNIGIFLREHYENNIPLPVNGWKAVWMDNLSTKSSNIVECVCKIKNIEIPVNKMSRIIQAERSTTHLKRCTKLKRGYVKLYNKCKSTSNISSESRPLQKIENLDDFFQLLGLKKHWSGVFDGHTSRKIMSSIVEMKNWINEINPRQALLVLLLVNKKETPNLVRFRPIILQGIAVNRITRVSELDTEIEVIEKENLNSFLQFEGISYLPVSTENQENLLEELYWIAKTTASDYQKPFDESSEKLLKSLLEKRKKLNPSYLRLMARYVGLGLLKSPTKK